MPRIRSIKPETFDDPDLCALSFAARWLFIGLWTQADRAGRLEDDVRRLKVRLLPYDNVDVGELLDMLAAEGFVARYKVAEKSYLVVNNFTKHQRPHPKETASVIPAPAMERNGRPGKKTASKVDPGSGKESLDPGSGKEPGDGTDVPSFADFKAAWPAARWEGAKQARAQWDTLDAADRAKAVVEVVWRVEHDRRWQGPATDGKWAIVYPFRYLQNRRFEDARPLPSAPPAPAPRNGRPPTDPDAFAWCLHEPHCGTVGGHELRLARDARASRADQPATALEHAR